MTTTTAAVDRFQQALDLVAREGLLAGFSTARLEALADKLPTAQWTESDHLAVGLIRHEYARRCAADAQRMTTVQILGALTPIADLTEVKAPSVHAANHVYTAELTARHAEARAAELAWFRSATRIEDFQCGPARAVIAAVMRAHNWC
ncbi:hypothetical protein ACOQFV_24470 [Nocardiopsis changdeensis]|uniref:DUF222 domain-containing protein n=1 Tax=Nocardiopsis changdeensis TaxID=2831969 RepID=A0A975QCA1_9ACTN|nr:MULTISPECIES: hypothetical protein [Nocardiopsis]QUX26454.1 hypothetical protein KGD84_32670 [Nocardiopsis changdeensis]QYX40726.1 hypothetical protein K1J57_32520 [Nocardiopsis sp. MT53]